MYRSTGVLRYQNGWLVVDADDRSLTHYYRKLIPEYVDVQPPKYPGHITVIRPEYETPINAKFWGKYQGQSLIFHYLPLIYFGEFYCWLNCFSKDLEDIREELGLCVEDEYTIPPKGFRKCFHMTVGNFKHQV